LLWSAALASGIVFALCGGLAIYLDTQQAKTAAFLSENIGSRKAADNLEEALAGLILYHERQSGEVGPLQERVKIHLQDIINLSDKKREQELSGKLKNRIDRYLDAYREERLRGDSTNRAYLILKEDSIKLCQDLQTFNEDQIEKSEQEHRKSVRWMSWGLLIVGSLGSLAGMLLGYGLARSLRRTLHQFLVRVQGASERLGQETSTVEWQGDDAALREGTDDLVHQVEKVVEKLQQNDREIRRSERLAAVGQLAAGVAHEIRNPLTSAILLIETGRKDPQSGGVTDEDLTLIEQELQRIESTLKIFLDFARPPKLERLPCELISIIKESLQLHRRRLEQQGTTVNFHPAQSKLMLDGDPQQLRQVFDNLILNALDMMPFGGRLEITTRPQLINGLATLYFCDTGPGIREDILPRLFEPFATGKETGIGLGLVISKRIVEEHGGSIIGYNRPSGGACFELRLLVAEDTE
jgi:two-component system sensor histidine kinase HydH